MLQCVPQYTFLSTLSLANVDCSEPLVQFQAPGLCSATSSGCSLSRLSASLLLSCVLETTLPPWISRIACSNSSWMRQTWGRANSKPWAWAWVAADLASSPVCPAAGTAQIAHPVPQLTGSGEHTRTHTSPEPAPLSPTGEVGGGGCSPKC